jgi:hypothetical protein
MSLFTTRPARRALLGGAVLTVGLLAGQTLTTTL